MKIKFFFSRQVDLVLLTTLGFFSSPKVPQLPSNLFINIVGDNMGFFFHYSLRVPQLSSNLTNFVSNNGF